MRGRAVPVGGHARARWSARPRQALREGRAALAMVYHASWTPPGTPRLHVRRPGGYQLGHVDLLAEQLAEALPPGAALYVTADHGMVDSAPATGSTSTPSLSCATGVALLGGEPRARHVYARPGAAADVLAAWQEALGGAAWVVSREEAIDEGWFGPVAAAAGRTGSATSSPPARGTSAIVATQAEPRESALVGMHGSLAAADQLVPLLPYRAGGARPGLSTGAAGKPGELSTESKGLSTV